MIIKSLNIKNFRNYSDINVEFHSNKILFIGKNAQGKTNLLEAIYYLSNLHSFRANSDSELIKWNENICSLSCNIIKNDVDIRLDVIINPPSRKKLKINGLSKNKTAEFISSISTVCFTTNDLLLLRGVPEDRRRWVDDAIIQIYPAYSERLAKYNKIKTQKNNYLKNLKGNINADTSLLDIWNEQLAITGSNIIFIRLSFLHELQNKALIKHKQIAPKENLSIIYNSSITGDVSSLEKVPFSIECILGKFKNKLEEKKPEEIIRGQSVIGPHRDDISFIINNTEAKKYASQGQQRTVVLSLKLAELEMIKEKTGANAILLLDDVLAELDDIRQNFLLNSIGNETQTIITSVDSFLFGNDYLKDVEIFEIKENGIKKTI